jgi:3-oxoacyl-[acyl-carrier protein] reductase
MLLQGKTAFITGASKGIGKAIAKIFAENGANLILVSRDMQALELVKTEILGLANVDVHLYQADIRKQEQLKEVFTDILQNKKLLFDILVNNAGIMKDATLQMVKPDLIEDIYQTNVFAVLNASQLALKSFLRLRKGCIINLSSIIGTNGNHGQTVYGSSKTAVIGISKSLAKELAPLQIRVNSIAPGFIDTDMTKGMDAKFYEKNLAAIGMKRLGTPEDVAKVALFLASDLSEYVTGQTIGVDGGMVI